MVIFMGTVFLFGPEAELSFKSTDTDLICEFTLHH